MAGSLTDARANMIRRSCKTISVLYRPATLISLRLAKPATGDENNGGHSKYPRPHSPVLETALDEIGDTRQWLLDASTQCGMPRDQGYEAVKTDPEWLALWIGDHADTLASEPDGAQWDADAAGHAIRLRKICRDMHHDSKRWRGLLVAWNPSQIADTLTDLTGRPVRADRVRKTVSDRRVKQVDGKVILGEIASAMRL